MLLTSYPNVRLMIPVRISPLFNILALSSYLGGIILEGCWVKKGNTGQEKTQEERIGRWKQTVLVFSPEKMSQGLQAFGRRTVGV